MKRRTLSVLGVASGTTTSIAVTCVAIPLAVVWCASALAGCGGVVPANPTVTSFTVSEVGLLAPGTHSIGNDLNDAGEVVGGAEVASGVGHAFSWTKSGGLVDLGAFGSTLSASALSVNNGGVVAGEILLNSGGGDYTVPFVLGGIGAQQPGVPPSCDATQIFGIANSGQLVVEGELAGLPFGSYILSGGTYVAIGETGGAGHVDDISYFNRHTNSVCGSLSGAQAVRWKWTGGTTTVDDWTTVLATIQTSSYYTGGAKGEWLGTLTNGDAGFVSADGGTVTDLGHVGSVCGLNATGQAVGNYTNASGHQHGFYWTKAAGFVDLNTMIDSSLGITIAAANGINASAQIMCQIQDPNVPTDSLFGLAGLLTPKK